MDHTTAEKAMEELTMALLYLSRFTGEPNSDNPIFRAWKGYDFSVLNTLEEKGYLYQGKQRSRTKGVDLTESGMEYGKSLLEKYGIEDWTPDTE